MTEQQEPKTLTVSAKVHTDDFHVEVEFDATDWFINATDEEIIALREIEFGGNTEADQIAKYFEQRDPEVKGLFAYLATSPTMMSGDTVGFECHVDADEAEAWITASRPHLSLQA